MRQLTHLQASIGRRTPVASSCCCCKIFLIDFLACVCALLLFADMYNNHIIIMGREGACARVASYAMVVVYKGGKSRAVLCVRECISRERNILYVREGGDAERAPLFPVKVVLCR